MIRFTELEWRDSLVDDLMPLLVEHYREIAKYRDIPLMPDFTMYRHACHAGLCRIFAMIDEKIVGYAIFFVKHNPHYMTSLQAVQDILFLDPSVRKGTNAIRFIKWCDEQLRAEGVQVVMHHIKVYKDWGRILERLGYEEVDKIYAKRLDYGNQRSDFGVYRGCVSSGGGSGSYRREEDDPQTSFRLDS